MLNKYLVLDRLVSTTILSLLHGHEHTTLFLTHLSLYLALPGDSDGKESACNAGAPASIPELGRSPGEGNGYPLDSSCLENSTDRGAW